MSRNQRPSPKRNINKNKSSFTSNQDPNQPSKPNVTKSSEFSNLKGPNSHQTTTKPGTMCDCAPLAYSRILGPTADESILQGIKTMMDICKIFKCPSETFETIPEETEESDGSENNTEETIPTVRSLYSTSSERKSGAISTTATVLTQTSETKVTSTGIQIDLETKVRGIQTDPEPEKEEPEKVSVKSAVVETEPVELISTPTQTDFVEKPPEPSALPPESVPGPAPVPEKAKRLSVKQMESCREEAKRPNKFTLNSLCSCETSSTESSCGECNCGNVTYRIECRCSSSTSKEADGCEQAAKAPVALLGTAPNNQVNLNPVTETDEVPSDVRYAVTKITRYKNFTTYEVMKSTRNAPKHIPKYMEGIFVLKKRDTCTACKPQH